MTNTQLHYSPAPWAYEYNPYVVTCPNADGNAVESDLPAFEVFDDNGNKVFDTNEDSPAEQQEANARLGSLLPEMLAVLQHMVSTADMADGCQDWRWEHLDATIAAARDILTRAAP